MELPKSPQNPAEEPSSLSSETTLDRSIALFLRLSSYGGPSQPPSGLAPGEDPEIASLLEEIVRQGKGEIVDRQRELWSAHFADARHALSAAKTLQQRFLTFQRKTEPRQVVPSILIYGATAEKIPGPDEAAPEDMLANVTSAQILIAESIYEQWKTVPGFKFNSKPVREAGETFSPEAIYEMLWTDESTYGHLRQASRAGLKTVGRYQIQEELGRGAMGAVYKAYDELIGRTVALKTISIDPHAPNRDDLIERLQQEAKAAGRLDHPNIITIYDVGQQDDVVYLSMQYVKGITLASLLDDVGVPSLGTFLSWADQISLAVGFAHARGVIHRDLKPANLMVTEDGLIKVLDFGIAKIGNTSLTQTGLVVGTPSYMAPEQLAGKKVDQRADIFSLGSVFYELVTSERPFLGDVTTILYKIVNEDPVAPSLVNPAIPGGIDAVIRKALSKDPKERFQTCEEMRAAFAEQAARMNLSPAITGPAAISGGKPKVQAAPPLPSFLLTEPPPKRRSLWPIAFMLLFMATGGWAFYVHQTTGFYPAFVNDLVSASEQLPETLHHLKPAPLGNQDDKPATGQGVQSTTPNDASSAPASSPGTPAGTSQNPPSGAVPNASDGSDGQTPSSASPADGEGVSPTDGTGAVMTTQATPPTTSSQTAAIPANSQAASASGTTAHSAERSPFSPDPKDSLANPALAQQTPRRPFHPPVQTADGFARKDVPELLRVADVAARRGDYRLATYEYNLILKLDHNNLPARNGLRLIRSEEHLR